MIHTPKIFIFVFIFLFSLYSDIFAQQNLKQSTQKNKPEKIQKNNESQPPIRYLQISTNPSTVDLFVGSISPDFAGFPDYTSPAFIPIPDGNDNVTVSFFHTDYADTTINIKLSDKDTSFIIVALRQTYDEELIASKQDMLKHRNRRYFGRNLRWASIVPFAISGVSAIVSLYNISKAKDSKKAMENTHLLSEKYDEHMNNFKDHRGSAKTAKTVSGIFLATGFAFLTIGFVLSF